MTSRHYAAPRTPHAVLSGLGLLAAVWLGLAACTPQEKPAGLPATTEGVAVEIEAVAIPLNEENPQQTKLGALTYVGGWALQSHTPAFGGWSGMVRTGSKLIAISDDGHWLKADLAPVLTATYGVSAHTPTPIGDTEDTHAAPEEAALAQAASTAQQGAHPASALPTVALPQSPFENVRMGSFAGRDSLENAKASFDAEEIIPAPYGYLISFEQDHRILFTEAPGAPMTMVDLPEGTISALSANGGFEAMTWDADNRLLLFVEEGRDTAGRLPLRRITTTGSAKALETFKLDVAVGFAPTAARLLPDGGILLIARAFNVNEGVRIIVGHISADDYAALTPGGTLSVRELARLKAPYSVDNMEALELLQLSEGGLVRFAILSDDNKNRFQRTLFMVFDAQL